MGRPRRPFNGSETIETMDSPWMEDSSESTLGTRQRLRWDASLHWRYRVPNGQNDPLTHLYVLGALMNISPEIELRAANLACWLNNTAPAFSWDSVTVGKVLSDLCDAFESVLGAKCGLLERNRDQKSQFYVFHRNPETGGLARRLYQDRYLLAEAEIAAVAARRPANRSYSPLLECPAARGEFQVIE